MTAQPDRREKRTWIKDTVMVLICMLGSFIIYAMQNNKDDEKEVINKINEKANIDYVDKQDNNIRAEFNSKIDIVINNQKETNSLLRDIIKN